MSAAVHFFVDTASSLSAITLRIYLICIQLGTEHKAGSSTGAPVYRALEKNNFGSKRNLGRYSQVKWEVMKRKEVPKKVKQIPSAPLVLNWDTIRVVTVAHSTSVGREKRHGLSKSAQIRQGQNKKKGGDSPS